MRNVFVLLVLSCLLTGCAETLVTDKDPVLREEMFSPVGRIIRTPKVDNVPLIGPPSTDLW